MKQVVILTEKEWGEFKQLLEQSMKTTEITKKTTEEVKQILTPSTKFCNKCKEHKPLNEFAKNKNEADGKQRYCKSCSKQAVKNSQTKRIMRTAEVLKPKRGRPKKQIILPPQEITLPKVIHKETHRVKNVPLDVKP